MKQRTLDRIPRSWAVAYRRGGFGSAVRETAS